MTPMEWLQQDHETTGEPNLALLAKLYCKNRGNFRVDSWGDHADGMPFYDGRYGLTWEEAIDMLELGHFLDGMLAATDGEHKDEVALMISDEIETHRRWTPGVFGPDDLSEN